MSHDEDSETTPTRRLKAALDRITTTVAGGEASPEAVEFTADKAEEIADLVERSKPGSYLWGHVSGGGPAARALFVLGLVETAAAPDTKTPRASYAEGTVVFQPEHEGPPGYAQGGIIAGLLDDICGIAVSTVAGAKVLTRHLTITFRRPTPLGRRLTVRGEVTNVADDAVTVEATIHDGDEVFANASGTFVPRR